MNTQRLGCVQRRASHPFAGGRRSLFPALAWVALFSALAGCSEPDGPPAPWTEPEKALMYSLSPPPKTPPPSQGNPVADDPKAARFGQRLFYDTRLSSNGSVSCASCHRPERFFTDGLPVGQGVSKGKRNTPTLLGAHWLPFLFWDGRTDSVWAQALGPLETPEEHGLGRVETVRKIYEMHRAEYEALFGALPDLSDERRFPPVARPDPLDSTSVHHQRWISMHKEDQKLVNTAFANVGRSLEAFTRQLTPQPAPFDAYVAAVKANDPNASTIISDEAKRGLRAFMGKAQCIGCHNGALFTDGAFHNLGLPRVEGQTRVDIGRSMGAAIVKEHTFACGGSYSEAKDCDELRFLNPRFEDFLGAFKTPTLRNIEHTGPYMHDGRFQSLEEVITFYKTLPGPPTVGHRELILSLLDSRVSTSDLVAFLKTLSGPLPDPSLLKPLPNQDPPPAPSPPRP